MRTQKETMITNLNLGERPSVNCGTLRVERGELPHKLMVLDTLPPPNRDLRKQGGGGGSFLCKEVLMSWYIGVDIYTKEKGSDWKAAMVSNYWLPAKALCNSRGVLDSDIELARLSDEERKELIALEHKNDNVEDVVAGTIYKEDWAKLVSDPNFKYHIESANEVNRPVARFVVDNFDSKDMVQRYDVDGVTLINTPAEQRAEKFLTIYYTEIKSRGYGGNFYDSDSFYCYAEKVSKKLDELIVEKADWERVQKSLDYLKLSPEEKQNISDEFDYIDEDIAEYRSRYDAAISMANILEFFSEEYETKAVAYMFGD